MLPTRSATQAALVAAAVRCERVNLGVIARRMAGEVAAKTSIKQARRFTCNRRIEVAAAMLGVIPRVAGRRRKPLLVSLERTDVRPPTPDPRHLHRQPCHAAFLVQLHRGEAPARQNSLEELLLRTLEALLPPSCPVIILADREFGRAEWVAVCQKLDLLLTYR